MTDPHKNLSDSNNQKEEVNNNSKKIIFQNVLISLFLSPFILISYVLLIAIKLNLGNKEASLISGIFSIFFIYNCLLLILAILYISIFEKHTKKKITIFSIIVIIAAFIYPILFIENGNQELGWGMALNILLVAFGTSYFIAIGLRKLYNYIFKTTNKEDITNKLSFINKILLGIITLTGSIISLILTFQKLFH